MVSSMQSDSDDSSQSAGTIQQNRVLKPIEKRHLFSNVLCVCLSSGAFMRDLESRWLKQAPQLQEVCDLVVAHATGKNFHPYIIYLRNQSYQTKTLRKLNEQEPFRHALNRLHSDPIAGKNHLDSFLALPMQRLTRLKLLVEVIQKLQLAVLQDYEKAKSDSSVKAPLNMVTLKQQQNTELALIALKRLLAASETEKRLMDQKARLLEIANSSDFPENVKSIAFSGRTLIKEGELKSYSKDNRSSVLKMLSGKRQSSYYLILFDDMLVVTKNRNGRFKVLDYCERAAVEAFIRPASAVGSEASSPPTTSSSNSSVLENDTDSSTRTGSSKPKHNLHHGSPMWRHTTSQVVTTPSPTTTKSPSAGKLVLNRSSSSVSAKSTSPALQIGLSCNSIGGGSGGGGQYSSSINPTHLNQILELHLKKSHNGSCTELRLSASSLVELENWYDALSEDSSTNQSVSDPAH